MRENRTCGSEGGEGVSPSRPLSSRLCKRGGLKTDGARGHSDARSGTGPTSQGRKTLKSGEKRGAYAEVVLRGLRALGSALRSDSDSVPGVGAAGILLPWAAS